MSLQELETTAATAVANATAAKERLQRLLGGEERRAQLLLSTAEAAAAAAAAEADAERYYV